MPETRQLTVGELIDYLLQFNPEHPIYLSAEDIPEDGDGIALDCIDFNIEGDN